MAAFVFNVAKGRVNELHRRVDGNDPANSGLVRVVLKTAEAEAALKDYATLAAIFAGGGGSANVEANFTNYARDAFLDADLAAPTVDNTNDRQDADLDDTVYTAAGGGTNNTTVRMITCYDPDVTGGTDADLIPLIGDDFAITTNGGDVTYQTNAAGYYRNT